MSGIFAILCVLSSAFLVIAVVIQNSKGGGLASAFGASNISSMIGQRRGNDIIEKATWILISSVMGLAFLSNLFGGGEEVNIKSNRISTDMLESRMGENPIQNAAPVQQDGGGQPTE